jgi:hypothetical protein
MVLAFSFSDVSLQTWVSLVSLITAVLGFATAWFKHKGMVREAAIASALFSGMRVAALDLATSKDPVATLEDAVLAAAKDYGVHEHVDDRMGPGLISAPGGGTTSPTISPVPPPAGGSK